MLSKVVSLNPTLIGVFLGVFQNLIFMIVYQINGLCGVLD